MLITIPGTAAGRADATSVLDLEPLLLYARRCRPDAVSLMPPVGADDQPNGAALLTMKDRLAAEGLAVVAGCLEIPEDAPVQDPAWQAQSLFEARALVAALGEAGVGPLAVRWNPSAARPDARQALLDFVGPLVEEAERAQVRLALQARLPFRELGKVLRQLESPYLGVRYDFAGPGAGQSDAGGQIRSFGEKLFVFHTCHPRLEDTSGALNRTSDGSNWRDVVSALMDIDFSGPVHLEGEESPVEYAHAVGFFRGLLAAAG
jgi:sugar phosphate isomerase/epimerase